MSSSKIFAANMKFQRKDDEGKFAEEEAVVLQERAALKGDIYIEEPDHCGETPRGQHTLSSRSKQTLVSPGFTTQNTLSTNLNLSFGHFDSEHEEWLRTTHFDHDSACENEPTNELKQNAEQEKFIVNTNLSSLHTAAFHPNLFSNPLSQNSIHWQQELVESQSQIERNKVNNEKLDDITFQKVFTRQKTVESVDSFLQHIPPSLLNSANFKEIFNSFSETGSFNNQDIIVPTQTIENFQLFNQFSQKPSKLKIVTENKNLFSQILTVQEDSEDKENSENINSRPKRKATQKENTEEYLPELKKLYQKEKVSKQKSKRPYFVRANHTAEQIEEYETKQKAKKKEKNRELAQLSRRKKRRKLEFLETKVKQQTELISSLKSIILNCFCEKNESCDCKKLTVLIPKLEENIFFELSETSEE